MPLSEKEKMQIRDVVDQVMEIRLMEMAEIQLSMISDMLLKMTDKYVESLMKLAYAIAPEASRAAQKEASRMTELMMETMKRR